MQPRGPQGPWLGVQRRGCLGCGLSSPSPLLPAEWGSLPQCRPGFAPPPCARAVPGSASRGPGSEGPRRSRDPGVAASPQVTLPGRAGLGFGLRAPLQGRWQRGRWGSGIRALPEGATSPGDSAVTRLSPLPPPGPRQGCMAGRACPAGRWQAGCMGSGPRGAGGGGSHVARRVKGSSQEVATEAVAWGRGASRTGEGLTCSLHPASQAGRVNRWLAGRGRGG